MDEHAAQRAARRTPGCQETPTPLTPPTPQPPHPRREDPCIPATPKQDEVFIVPSAIPTTPSLPPYRLPALTIGNVLQIQTCADIPGAGPSGASVTVAANIVTAAVPLQNIPNLTDDQGRYISGLALPALLALETAQDWITVTKLNPSQAVAAVAAVAAAQAQANQGAQEMAQGQLQCVWLSAETTTTCPAGALATGSATPDGEIPQNPVTIVAGTYSSAFSQADADAQAEQAALTALKCIWLNTPITQTCLDIGYTEAVPVDTEPAAPGLPLRVGSITILAGVVASDASAAEANAQALQMAISALDCFYVNAPVTASCADLGMLNTAPTVPGNDTELGNPVTIPVGVIVSTLSVEDANAQALVLAQSMLDCFWLNGPVTAQCPEMTVNPGLPDVMVYQPSPTSPVLAVTIPAGTLRSVVSQADANAQALALAQGQLDCLYCNQAVPPVCTAPPGSLDATTGVPANTYCSADPSASQNIAEQLGTIPMEVLTDGTLCQYGNGPITVTCDTLLGPGSNALVAPGARKTATVAANTILVTVADLPQGFAGTPQDYANQQALSLALSLLDCFFISAPITVTCADLGLQNVYRLSVSSVTIAAGTFVSYTNQAEADLEAYNTAVLSLNCYYANAASWFYCDDGANTGAYNPNRVAAAGGGWVYGTGSMLEIGAYAVGRFPVAPGSRGSVSRPVFVAEATFTSYASQAEVDAMTLNYAIATLDCFFENQPIDVLCGASTGAVMTPNQGSIGDPASTLTYGTGIIAGTYVAPGSTGSTSDPVVINRGTFTDPDSRGAADLQALLVAVSQLNCFFLNNPETAMCPMAPGGPEGIILGNFSTSAVYTITTPAGTITSYVSQADADSQALQQAEIQLLCVYANGATAPGTCPAEGNTFQVSNGALQANSVTSFLSQADAQQTAQTMTQALTSCVNPQQLANAGAGGGTGGGGGGGQKPGNDGAQTNCQGNCFGYFS